MRSDTLTVRDRILAALFEHELDPAVHYLLSTTEVCNRAGTYDDHGKVACCLSYGRPEDHARQLDPNRNPWATVLACDGRTHTMRYHLSIGNRGYRELAALERQGRVVKHRSPVHKSVFWSLAVSQRDEMLRAAAQLEAMWVLS